MGQSASKTTDIRKTKDVATPQKLKDAALPLVDSTPTPNQKKFIDPRSPYVCRTPLESLSTPNTPFTITKQLNLTTDDQNLTTPNRISGAQPNFLQQKLLKNLGFQMFDPRSPTQFINRTPISLEKTAVAVIDQTFDCSVADDSIQAIELSNASMIPCSSTLDEPITASATEDDTTSMDKFIAELEIDPRSPSIDVERTPIVFKESESIEQNDAVELEVVIENTDAFTTPNKNHIYEDEAEPVTPNTDENSLKLEMTTKTANNRTPLSCLRNNRSRQGQGVHKQSSKLPKHPILFIGQHQNASTPKIRKSLVPFGNNQQSASSKIPVFKNSIL